MQTNKDGHETQIVARGDTYLIAQIVDGKVQWWDGRKRQFGSFYLRSAYRSSRLAENIRATIQTKTYSTDLNNAFHDMIRDTDA